MPKKFPHQNVRRGSTRLLTPSETKNDSVFVPVEKKDIKPSVSLKYIDLRNCCFSDLKDNHKLKLFDTFLSKLNKAPNWETVYRTFQRETNKDRDSIQKIKSLGFDPDQIEMFHLRVSQKYRVQGFMYESRFKLVWLDPDHHIHKK